MKSRLEYHSRLHLSILKGKYFRVFLVFFLEESDLFKIKKKACLKNMNCHRKTNQIIYENISSLIVKFQNVNNYRL